MVRRLDAVLDGLDIRSEVILVDDGSSDRSSAMMRDLCLRDPRFSALILSRNYGHQIALSAGLELAAGAAVVVLDADLQDPPELIPEMLARWRDGYDVVFGQRTSRQGDSLAKRATARVFYRVIRLMSDVSIPENVGDFRLMDRKVVQAIRRMPERFRFVRGLVAWAGFRQIGIAFERAPRHAGVTKYPWRKMIAFALDAIFAFSVVPLRLATLIGLAAIGLTVLEIVRTLYLRFVMHSTVPGFSAIFVAVLCLGGLNLLFLGIVGEYVGRTYVETKGRPLFFVEEYIPARTAEPRAASADGARSTAP